MEPPNSAKLLRSHLVNRIVIDLQTAEELGRVIQVLVDIRSQTVAALACGGGVLHRGGHNFLWNQVNSVGRDGVVIRADKPTAESSQNLQEAIPLAQLELWSDNGDRMGWLTDFGFDPQSGQIVEYRFVAGETSGLKLGLYQFEPQTVVSTGRRRMMVHDQALRQATLLDADIHTLPTEASRRDLFGYDIPDPRQGWESAVEGTREMREQFREQFAEQFQERGDKLRTEAQEKLSGFLGNVKQRTRRLRNQMRETVTDITAGLPSGQKFDDNDEVKTIEVDSTELWSRDDNQSP